MKYLNNLKHIETLKILKLFKNILILRLENFFYLCRSKFSKLNLNKKQFLSINDL